MKDKFPSWRPFLILINFHSNETSNAWLRKGEKIAKTNSSVIYRGGHWGILETAKPKKKSSKTAKPQKNSAKTENRIQNRQKPIQWWQVGHTEQTKLTLISPKYLWMSWTLSEAFVSFCVCLNHNIKQSSVFIKILKSNNTRFFGKANSTLLAWSAKRKPKDPKKSNNTRQKQLTWLVQRNVGHGEVLNYQYDQQRVWLPCEQSLLTSLRSCTLRYCVFSMY